MKFCRVRRVVKIQQRTIVDFFGFNQDGGLVWEIFLAQSIRGKWPHDEYSICHQLQNTLVTLKVFGDAIWIQVVDPKCNGQD